MRKKFRLGENEKEIIKYVGLGLFVATSLVIPNLPVAFQPIMKMRGNKGLHKLITKLRNKNVIELGEDRIKLTKKGKELLREIQLSEIIVAKTRQWDGLWRLVSYDIPEKYKKSRNLFRCVLERNNFYQIQKSLWACPWPCKEEIAILAKNINVSEYVVFMETNKLSDKKELTMYYNLDE